MKKSTIKLIIFTVLGIIASIIFFQLSKNPNPMWVRSVKSQITVGMYVCPFIGLIYWLFCRHLDD